MLGENDKRKILRSCSVEETISIGEKVGRRLGGGLCMVLKGGLGSGKTIMIKGICRGLGIHDDILSPTFILYEEFHGRLPVVHLDLYRMEHERELEELGVFDKLGSEWVILAEWGDRSDYLFRASSIIIALSITGESTRLIEVLEKTRDKTREIE